MAKFSSFTSRHAALQLLQRSLWYELRIAARYCTVHLVIFLFSLPCTSLWASLALLRWPCLQPFCVSPSRLLSLCRLPNMFLAGLTVCFFFWYLCMLATGWRFSPIALITSWRLKTNGLWVSTWLFARSWTFPEPSGWFGLQMQRKTEQVASRNQPILLCPARVWQTEVCIDPLPEVTQSLFPSFQICCRPLASAWTQVWTESWCGQVGTKWCSTAFSWLCYLDIPWLSSN